MVSAHMATYYLYIHTCTYLSYELSQPYPNVLADHRLAVFRYPHDMILDIVYTMRRLTVILHNTASILKSSSKDEGFSPIPRMGH